jgi:hypothetical protein
MANGRVIRVCPERTFTFTDLGNNDVQEIVIAERIDCSQYTYVDLIARVHSATIGAVNAKIEVKIACDAWTPEDPTKEFKKVLTAATVELNSTSVASIPVLLTGSASSQLGAMLKVIVAGTQPSSATTLTARISIDLVLKSCL